MWKSGDVNKNTDNKSAAREAGQSNRKKLMPMSFIRQNGGEASFSELSRYTIIHVATGKRRFTNRRPSLSYYSPLFAWDNERNEPVPNRKR